MVDAPLAGRSAGAALSGPPAGNLALRVCGTEYNGRVVRLTAPKCTIGSSESCTLRIHALGVAPVHCLIVRGATGTAVRRWSRSTRLNGGVFFDSPLHVGDRLGVGPLEFEVVEDALVTSPTPAEADEPAATHSSGAPDEAQRQEWEQRVAELQAELAAARQALESERNELQAALDVLRVDLSTKDSELAAARQALESERNELQAALEALRADVSGKDMQLAELSARLAETPSPAADEPAATLSFDASDEALRQEWEQRVAGLHAELEAVRQAKELERNELQAGLDALRVELDAKDSQLAELSTRLGETPSAATPSSDASDEAQRLEWEKRVAELQAELEAARQAMEHERNELEARLDALRVDLSAKTSQLAELSARLAESPSSEDLERRAQAWEEKRRALHEKLEAAEEAARLAEERAAQWEQTAAQRYTPEGLAERETELRRREEDVERRQEEAETVLVQTRRRLEELRHREEDLWQRDRELRQREAELLRGEPGGCAESDSAPHPAAPPLAGEDALSSTMALPMRELDELPGENSGPPPTSRAADVLAKLGYAPDWSEEAETPPGAAPAEEAAPAESSFTALTPTPAPAESEPEAEDSIEDYMAMLLQRVRGDGRGTSGKPAAPRVSPRPAPAPAPSKKPAAKKPAAAGVTIVLGEAEASDGPKITAEEFIPRSLAPERIDRLAAMREVANVSARSAIGRHFQMELLTRAMAKGAFALLAAAGAAYLAYAGRGASHATTGAAGAAAIFALLWSAQAVFQFRRYLRVRREAKAAGPRQPASKQVAPPEKKSPPAEG
jgi:hypothetical protein